MEQKVTWGYESEHVKVQFEFDSSELDTKEVFMRWVQWMNSIGYILDAPEMEAMWSGE